MSHEITGERAFFLKTPAWHKIGKVFENELTDEEAIEVIHPEALDEYRLAAIDDDGNVVKELEKFKTVLRSGDLAEIACHRMSFETMQPWEHGKFFRPYLESGDVTLEAGGILREGTRMWLLGKLNKAKAEVVKGDTIAGYLLASTGFDGSLAYNVRLTNMRVVCANTLAWALEDGAIQQVSHNIRHTKNMRVKEAEVQEEIAKALSDFYKLTDTYQALAAKKMTAAKMIDYVKDVFVSPELEAKLKEENKELSTQMKGKINRVIDLIEGQSNLELVPAIRGTAWQCYNAVSEYLTHEHGRTDQSRLNGQWFGDSARVNNRAMKLALTC
jgi:phage/plasmid-like protein (TIGR03299 family)